MGEVRVCIIGHSNVALRQQLFGRELARQGHEVLMVAPGQWGGEITTGYTDGMFGTFELVTLRHIGDTIYNFRLLGAQEAVTVFNPEWLYVQQEALSALAWEAAEWPGKWKKAIFIWENLRPPTIQERTVLRKYDLVVCGNDDAERLAREAVPELRTVILPQVGVDVEHFAVRDVPRTERAVFIGRAEAPEKGYHLAKAAWPGLGCVTSTPFIRMPWVYSQCQIVVCPSMETNWWREQAGPYVSWEANSCLTPVIVAASGSIPFWHTQYAGINPGVILISTRGMRLQADSKGKIGMICDDGVPEAAARAFGNQLADRINELLGDEALRHRMGQDGRDWVVNNLSNQVIAKKLTEALSA